ncbi:hypothetical protein FAGKG844_80028 [Frankia sp. AgKG'84/4]
MTCPSDDGAPISGFVRRMKPNQAGLPARSPPSSNSARSTCAAPIESARAAARSSSASFRSSGDSEWDEGFRAAWSAASPPPWVVPSRSLSWARSNAASFASIAVGPLRDGCAPSATPRSTRPGPPRIHRAGGVSRRGDRFRSGQAARPRRQASPGPPRNDPRASDAFPPKANQPALSAYHWSPRKSAPKKNVVLPQDACRYDRVSRPRQQMKSLPSKRARPDETQGIGLARGRLQNRRPRHIASA